MLIREVTQAETHEWYLMRAALWPEMSEEMQTDQMEGYYASDGTAYNVFVADPEKVDGSLMGFIEVSINDWIRSGKTVRCAQIEGMYADPAGLVSEIMDGLLAAAEEWARSKSCAEFCARSDSREQFAHEAFARAALPLKSTMHEFVKTIVIW